MWFGGVVFINLDMYTQSSKGKKWDFLTYICIFVLNIMPPNAPQNDSSGDFLNWAICVTRRHFLEQRLRSCCCCVAANRGSLKAWEQDLLLCLRAEKEWCSLGELKGPIRRTGWVDYHFPEKCGVSVEIEHVLTITCCTKMNRCQCLNV